MDKVYVVVKHVRDYDYSNGGMKSRVACVCATREIAEQEMKMEEKSIKKYGDFGYCEIEEREVIKK